LTPGAQADFLCPRTVIPHFQDKNVTKNGTAHNRHQCRKTAVLCCHRLLINSGVEKMYNI
jgi:hypothetical protein